MTPDPTRTFATKPDDPTPSFDGLPATVPHDGTAPTTIAAATHPASQGDAPHGYEIEGELGRGGMGVVYKARQIGLNRTVALKMILSGAHATERDNLRFLAEAEAVAAIKHPHVVQVYEIGNHAGRPYMALEYCDGGTLTALLKDRGKLPPQEAAELLEQIARGVAAAHEQGIVHRDLKPGNILLGPLPKVADFGLAKMSTGDDLTRSGVVMGTPAYMAPEQAKGDTKFVGPAADVYALGAMLFECLTGRPPFTGNLAEVLLHVVEDEPPAVRSIAPSTPRDLALICEKCLAKAAHERYATAGELAEELRHFLAGEPVSVRSVGQAERLVRWVRRKPTAAAAYGFTLLAIFLAVVVLVVAGLWREAERAKTVAELAKIAAEGAKSDAESARVEEARMRSIADAGLVEEARLRALANAGLVEEARLRGIADTARDDAIRQRGLADTARNELAVAKAKLDVVEYGRTIQVAQDAYHQDDIDAVRSLLEGTRKEYRNWEWQFVHRLAYPDLLTIPGHYPARVHGVDFSPDGTRILTASSDGTARVWDATTGALRFTCKGHTAFVLSAKYSSDGRRIVTTSADHSVRVWNATTGAAELVLSGHKATALTAGFSPDSKQIVSGGGDNLVKIWDLEKEGGEARLALKGHTGMVNSATFSSDGKRIVSASWDKTAKVWDSRTGEVVCTLRGHTAMLFSSAFSPDGKWVVTGSGDGTAILWELDSGDMVRTFQGHTGRVYSVAFSPDGNRILTAGHDGTTQVWDVKTGDKLFALRGLDSPVFSAAFNRDGSKIVTGSIVGTVSVWPAEAPTAVRILRMPAGIIWTSGFSPDGTRLVTGGEEGVARIWDTRTGAELRRFKCETNIMNAAFTSDGKSIYTYSGGEKGYHLWNAETGVEVTVSKSDAIGGMFAILSPDGTQFISGGLSESAVVVNGKTGKIQCTLPKHTMPVSAGAFDSDGARVATICWDGSVKVANAATGAELVSLPGHGHNLGQAVAFSPDGTRLLASGLKDHQGTVTVWDLASHTELFTLQGHTAMIRTIAFSPDGRRIVTASADKTAKIWDSSTGAELLTLRGHKDVVGSARFSPDGSKIATTGEDGTARIWDSSPVNRAFLKLELAPTPRPAH